MAANTVQRFVTRRGVLIGGFTYAAACLIRGTFLNEAASGTQAFEESTGPLETLSSSAENAHKTYPYFIPLSTVA